MAALKTNGLCLRTAAIHYFQSRTISPIGHVRIVGRTLL